MNRLILLIAALPLLSTAVTAQSFTLDIRLNKENFQPGDTIVFEARVPQWAGTKEIGTLNLWMEDINRSRIWKMRYPVLEGLAEGELILPKRFPQDQYALNFSLQPQFFEMSGQLNTDRYRGDSIRCVVTVGKDEILAATLSLSEARTFRLSRLLFADQATVYLSPNQRRMDNMLDFTIETPLDSGYRSLADTTHLISIGRTNRMEPSETYRFDRNRFENPGGTLEVVEVVGQRRTEADKFEEQYVTGFFRSSDSYTFDGLESNQLLGWRNIFDWLPGRVPGLIIRNGGNGPLDYNLQWQNSATLCFLDEMQVDAQTLATIPTADIAMVKVMRPPFYGGYLGGAGGAIAVYTKRGGTVRSGPRNKFIVNGYTPSSYTLNPYMD